MQVPLHVVLLLIFTLRGQFAEEIWEQDLSMDMQIGASTKGYDLVALRCGAENMIVGLQTSENFSGVIYTRGSFYSRQPSCFLNPDHGGNFTMTIPFNQCDTENVDNKYRNTLVLQHDDELITPGDAAFVLECDFSKPRDLIVSAELPETYTKPQPKPPQQDYLYQKYLEDLALRKDLLHPKVRLALFGVGRAGTIHLSNIISSSRVKLLYIVDDIESKWMSLKEYWQLDDVVFLNSKQADKVYNDPNVDAVVVASPTYTHEGIVRKALEAKKAVFCEKPIAEDNVNSIKCYETAKKVGKPLFCAFNRRFDPSYSAVRSRVRNGEVGHVQIIKTVSRDSPLPSIEYLKMSGGIFHDCMVHDIDIMTWVLGEYPIKIAVQAHAHIPEIKAINDFDTVVVTLHFPSGTLGTIDLSRNSSFGYDQRLEVFGPKGMIKADNEQPMHCVTSQYNLDGLTSAPIWYSFASRFMNGYRRELDHFVDVVLGRAECSVLPKETLAVIKIATACQESARTGKMVEIKWAPNELP